MVEFDCYATVELENVMFTEMLVIANHQTHNIYMQIEKEEKTHAMLHNCVKLAHMVASSNDTMRHIFFC